MTSAQVVETSVKVTNNSPSRDYFHPDDQTTQTKDYTDVITICNNCGSIINESKMNGSQLIKGTHRNPNETPSAVVCLPVHWLHSPSSLWLACHNKSTPWCTARNKITSHGNQRESDLEMSGLFCTYVKATSMRTMATMVRMLVALIYPINILTLSLGSLSKDDGNVNKNATKQPVPINEQKQ